MFVLALSARLIQRLLGGRVIVLSLRGGESLVYVRFSASLYL